MAQHQATDRSFCDLSMETDVSTHLAGDTLRTCGVENDAPSLKLASSGSVVYTSGFLANAIKASRFLSR